MKPSYLRLFLFSMFIFVVPWFFLYKSRINNLPIQSEDTIPAIFLPVTILKEKTLNLNTYYEMMLERYPHPDDRDQKDGLVPYYLREINGNYLSAFPIITPILSIPIYAIPVLLGIEITWENLIILSHISSAVIVSLSGVFLLYLLENYFELNSKKSLILVLIYLFATINLSLLSQALWQHGTIALFTILALIFLYRSFYSKNKNIFDFNMSLVGLMLTLAFLTRPTALLLVPFFGLLILEKSKFTMNLIYKIMSFILGTFPALGFFYWYNQAFYQDFSNQGYSDQFMNSWLSPFPEGFLGMWFSPSKGILIYSPILIFSIIGLYLAIRKGQWRINYRYIVFACIVILHTLFLSIWKHWYGGWGFGYRMASDVLVFFILLLVPYITSEFFHKFKKLFYFLFAVSVGVQIMGLVFFDGVWHAAYDDGFRDTAWLWSVENSETVFNIRRILVKFGYLDKACPQCL